MRVVGVLLSLLFAHRQLELGEAQVQVAFLPEVEARLAASELAAVIRPRRSRFHLAYRAEGLLSRKSRFLQRQHPLTTGHLASYACVSRERRGQAIPVCVLKHAAAQLMRRTNCYQPVEARAPARRLGSLCWNPRAAFRSAISALADRVPPPVPGHLQPPAVASRRFADSSQPRAALELKLAAFVYRSVHSRETPAAAKSTKEGNAPPY